MGEQLTHWKKNNDSTYISGEDLHEELNGLKKEQTVIISRFLDGEAYDQKLKSNVVKTVIMLKTEDGKEIYKGTILNAKAVDFLLAETGSPYLEKWVGVKCVMFAQADKRHGFVVRFKKYYAPPVDVTQALARLEKAEDMQELGAAWSTLSQAEQRNAQVIKLKEELKKQLS